MCISYVCVLNIIATVSKIFDQETLVVVQAANVSLKNFFGLAAVYYKWIKKDLNPDIKHLLSMIFSMHLQPILMFVYLLRIYVQQTRAFYYAQIMGQTLRPLNAWSIL